MLLYSVSVQMQKAQLIANIMLAITVIFTIAMYLLSAGTTWRKIRFSGTVSIILGLAFWIGINMECWVVKSMPSAMFGVILTITAAVIVAGIVVLVKHKNSLYENRDGKIYQWGRIGGILIASGMTMILAELLASVIMQG